MKIVDGELKNIIELAFDKKSDSLTGEDKAAVEEALKLLDQGALRVCGRTSSPLDASNSGWKTEAWLKKAILIYFRIKPMELMPANPFQFVDKIPLKQWTMKDGVRVVPGAIVRYGAHVASGAILMPSFVNIGAYVGSGTMVDTWATVGSCAQIGSNVHLSGGVGIGGVLEPAQAQPVIIEDNCFIGSRAIIVEGVHIEEGAVIGAGVVLTGSTPVIDATKKDAPIIKGRVPARSIVIPGSRRKSFAGGDFEVPCALIIGERSSKTDEKTSLNDALRHFE